MDILVISGMSGAGKSRVAATLEDMNFYCVDNMPVAMLTKFAEFCMASRGKYERVALVTDVRSQQNFDDLFAALDELRQIGCGYKIMYVEASVETIVKRYKETRHRHPLESDTGGSLSDAVRREIAMLAPVRERAEYIIDTSTTTIAQLQRKLYNLFYDSPANPMRVDVISFGFKYGVPLEADIVMDVRFLPNPYYKPELKELTGLDERVSEFVFSHGATQEFMAKFKDMLGFLLPNYIEEGKTSLVICMGCTGGHHRSVATAEAVAEHIRKLGYTTECIHRDIKK